MCGIAGFIGHAKKPKASYELLTNLFDFLETRGTDAAGFWVSEEGERGRVVYHKDGIKSSEFIKNDHWKLIRKLRMNIGLVHARATSKGGGHASNNINNHPFVSTDKQIAMVHNGTLDHEASFLKHKFETISNTDSEYLLRVYEHGLEKAYQTIKDVPNDVAKRMNGIKDIWSYVSSGAMAVAIGERHEDNARGLFLFRNEKRPLWIADMRKVLGQIFFFSTPDIWYRAVSCSDQLKDIIWGQQKLIEIPPFQVWHLRIDKEDTTVTEENLFKVAVNVSNSGREWDKGDYCEVKVKEPTCPVVTRMDKIEKPEPPKVIALTGINAYPQPKKAHKKEVLEYDDTDWNSMDDMPSASHSPLCEQIEHLARQIDTVSSNMSMEGSISPGDYRTIIDSLEQIKADLEGTYRMLDPN